MDDPLREFASAIDDESSTVTSDGMSAFPFRDPDLPIGERVEDLLDRLELTEMLGLLHGQQRAIPRLGVGPFSTGGEAVHGVAWMGEATLFPQPIGLASTWDPDLIARVGNAVGDEVRARHDKTAGGMGLNVWCPVTDPLRDPRWGRNEEGYSEDPLLSGRAAAAYASGLAGDDDRYLKTAPSLKHYAAYNREHERTTTNAQIPPRLLYDYYLEFFRPAIEAGDAVGVMSSYNCLNGRPMTASPLLSAPLREWAPDGSQVMNVSDAMGPDNLTTEQEYFDSIAAARAAALRAGLDSFTEGELDNAALVEALMEAYEAGDLELSTIEAAARHALSVRFRLGEFDPDERNPYANVGPEVVGRPEHRELAREAARKGTVLLKNDGVLPLSEEKTVAVVGPLSNAVFTDWYSGRPPYRITVRDGIRDRIGVERVEAAAGTDLLALRTVDTGEYVRARGQSGGGQLYLGGDGSAARRFAAVQWDEHTWTLRAMANDRYVTLVDDRLVNDADYPGGWETVAEAFEFVPHDDAVLLRSRKRDAFVTTDERRLVATADRGAATRFAVELHRDGHRMAAQAARRADRAVVVVGTHPLIGGRETTDRDSLSLPASQRRLVQRVLEANGETVVVLQSGNPVTAEWVDEHVPGVLWTSHAGQETGRALADVIFGEVTPGGCLTQTWPRSVEQLPPITEYDIAESGRTYRYGQENPLYAFGHGQSYAEFEYGQGDVTPSRLEAGETATVPVEVHNTGSMAGDEVVQVYTRQRESRVRQPDRVLRGFERVHVEPGETATVIIEIDHDDFAFWDVTRGARTVEPADHDVLIGSAVDDIRARDEITVEGTEIPPRDLTELTRAVNADGWSWAELDLLDRSRESGTVVGMTDGSWLTFGDVAFDSVTSTLAVSASHSGEESAMLEVRQGGPDGTLLGESVVPATDGRYDYRTIEVPLASAEGGTGRITLAHRGGDIRVDTVQFV